MENVDAVVTTAKKVTSPKDQVKKYIIEAMEIKCEYAGYFHSSMTTGDIARILQNEDHWQKERR